MSQALLLESPKKLKNWNNSTTKRSALRAPLISDYLLLGMALLLVGFSLVMVYSTTGIVSQERLGDGLFYIKRQAVAAFLGLLFMFGAMRIPRRFLMKVSPYLLPIALLLLIMTLIPGLGDSAGGAKRWVKLGFMRFQPAEFIKLALIIFMAGYFHRHEKVISTFIDGIVKPFAIFGLVGALLLLQPDFGSTAVLGVVVLAMAAAAGARLRYLGICSAVLALSAGFLVVFSPYRMKRVISFLSPWADASGKGYQLIQSLIAVGTGQVSGVGLGASQQKLFFLPAAHTDFIFAVISEELGFVGALMVIVAFFIIMWRGLRIASRVADDTFCFCLSVGLTMLIVVPALLNVGVVIGLLPTKGMVLPLIGYGGSSLIASMTGIGLLLGVYRFRNSSEYSTR